MSTSVFADEAFRRQSVLCDHTEEMARSIMLSRQYKIGTLNETLETISIFEEPFLTQLRKMTVDVYKSHNPIYQTAINKDQAIKDFMAEWKSKCWATYERELE